MSDIVYHMDVRVKNNIVSSREMQRNYRRIIDRAKKHGLVFLGAHKNPEVVLMNIEEYLKLKERRAKVAKLGRWKNVEMILDRIASKGRGDISLSQFIHYDRRAH